MLFTEDALYYVNQVKSKAVTSVELVERALKNIDDLNADLNAVTFVQRDAALKQAKEFDAQLAELDDESIQSLPPFFGVPTLLKDLGQAQAGVPSTSGAKIFKDFVPDTTDNYTQAVLDAGFVVVGRTNVPEFGFKGVSDSTFTGPVHSPFDLNRNPGGSSGGSAAALKAGIVPIAMASDGGGSIRIPASYSGLIGLKPSRGRIVVGPFGYRGWQGASVNFALTRSVEDTFTLLQALQAEQYEAPFMVPKITETELKPLNCPLKIAYSLEGAFPGEVLSEEAKQAILTAKEKLEALGHELVEATPPIDTKKTIQLYYKMNTVEAAAMIDNIEAGIGSKLNFGDIEPLTWLMTGAGNSVPAKNFTQVLNEWDQISATLETYFKTYDAQLFPITNGPAPKQGQFDPSDELIDRIKRIETFDPQVQQDMLWEYFQYSQVYMGFNAQMNLAGQPSIALPIYQTNEGLPIGVQLWSRKANDYQLLQVAKQLEDNGDLRTEIKEF